MVYTVIYVSTRRHNNGTWELTTNGDNVIYHHIMSENTKRRLKEKAAKANNTNETGSLDDYQPRVFSFERNWE